MADCPYCGCELTVPEELQKEFRIREELPDSYTYGVCPICDSAFLLENGRIVDEFKEVDCDDEQ